MIDVGKGVADQKCPNTLDGVWDTPIQLLKHTGNEAILEALNLYTVENYLAEGEGSWLSAQAETTPRDVQHEDERA